MPVSKERLREISNLVNGLRGDGVKPDDLPAAERAHYDDNQESEVAAFCRDVRVPEELYAFADMWNWDYGTWEIETILDNPACEAGIALMIYWRACPEYYLQFADRSAMEASDAAFQLDGFDFIAKLEARYLAGDFQTGSIAFDPRARDVVGAGEYDFMRDKFVRTLPTKMYEAVGPFQS